MARDKGKLVRGVNENHNRRVDDVIRRQQIDRPNLKLNSIKNKTIDPRKNRLLHPLLFFVLIYRARVEIHRLKNATLREVREEEESGGRREAATLKV